MGIVAAVSFLFAGCVITACPHKVLALNLDPVADAEDDLRPEYDFSQLKRVPVEQRHRRPRVQPSIEQIDLTSSFPEFDEIPDGFEWCEDKASANYRKHGVTFNEASTVFDDQLAVVVYDPDHSDDEDRYLIIGHSARGRLLIVSHTDREDGTRIISARECVRSERRRFENGDF